jgi:hypothetical protein
MVKSLEIPSNPKEYEDKESKFSKTRFNFQYLTNNQIELSLGKR